MIKTFYVQTNEQNKITDVIEFPHEGYDPVELSVPLPPQILGGAYELLNGSAVYHKEWDTPGVPPPPVTLDEHKTSKLAALGAACEAAIFAGVDVETTEGTEHFALTTNDQINISNLVGMVSQGAATAPYHADGALCREFTAAEVTALVAAATAYKTYHTTLCNHLNVWVRRCISIEEVQAITYASPLPPDLQANFDMIIGGAAHETA